MQNRLTRASRFRCASLKFCSVSLRKTSAMPQPVVRNAARSDSKTKDGGGREEIKRARHD
jgi:hypothetical protein